jgi:nicotinate dehydrogenase subunit B
VDEIAAELRMDPVQFRLAYLKNDKRISEALRTAAEKSGWTERPSPTPTSSEKILKGRGVAVNQRNGSIPALVAEVEVDTSTGKIRVTRVTIAYDCGLIINPDGVRNQIEGNMMQGVSRTLFEEVKFDATGVKSLDWVSYPVLRFQDVPDVRIQLINRPELPATGAPETPIVVVPAAIANRHLRCDRGSPPRNPVHPGARPERTQSEASHYAAPMIKARLGGKTSLAVRLG